MDINGVWIDGKHSWKDYQLWFTRRPQIATAEPKLKLVEIPGADGELDYTEAIDGTVKYNNREIVVEFTAFREVDKQAETIARLRGAWHGRTIQLEFDEEPGWIYTGRGNVQISNRTPHVMHITLTVLAEPFATAKNPTELDLLVSTDTTLASRPYIEIPHQPSPINEAVDSRFRFATGGSPYQDFSFFSYLEAYWDTPQLRQSYNPTVYLYIKDVDENEYYITGGFANKSIQMTLLSASNAGVDLEKITRVTVLNAPGAYLRFVALGGRRTDVFNAGPAILPNFSSTIEVDTEIYCNGYHTMPATTGTRRYTGNDLVLMPGNNQIIVRPNADTVLGACRMWFYEKR